ncbi:MAG: DUF262 domain-containing protein [Chloroflexi bacterium]|nr:DUF262 domain-containing protein [Chloroflexota bacterium]
MKTDKITVFDLFERQRRYLVPIFQRGYVWTQDQQWQPLWGDIAEQARLVQVHKGASRNTIRKHFLGAIVLSQVPTVIRQMPASEIIDGQQRLLTLQVFLAAFRDAVVESGDDYLKMQLGRLTGNPGPFYNADEQFKVWPTNAYQEDVKNVMKAGSAEALAAKYPQKLHRKKLVPPRPALVEAYFYFHDVIKRFLSGIDEEEALPSQTSSQESMRELANLLFEAVMRYVQIVEIQLDVEDDPQVIFETLNYRGVPLEPSDLIRNFIFLYASRQNKDVNALYNQWWKDYDEAGGSTGKFWKEKERQGRLFRSRLDLFFFHYLTYRAGHEIKMGHLYQEFKEWWDGELTERSLELELETAKRSSSVFRSLLEADDTSRLGILAQRLRALDTTTVYPFMLWLCEDRDQIAAEEFARILADIESYIVRRAICRLTPKNYNRIFLGLLTKLSREGMPSHVSVRRELLSLEGDSSVWPGNEAFLKSLMYEPLYDSLGPKRMRMVLTALELANRTPSQESQLSPVPINNNLTIEHIMPQKFKPEEWPYPEHQAAEKKEMESRRWSSIHSLGNLTLLTQPLNSEVSNGPFRAKRAEITKQSLLILNSYFQQFSDDDVWNETTIRTRSERLADLAVRLWAYPERTNGQ